MVKRPLTRIDYPPGPSARFGPLLAMERATYLQCFTISARLGYIGSAAQHHSPLSGGGQGAAARDNRRVLFPSSEKGSGAFGPSPVGPKPAGARQDEGSDGMGHSLPNGAGG